ncbi:hypothetical protein [Nocardioides coralli]|uniref:hypothetical protein n=1 Tax=Nocardioides coralli TaxID=2872154 RepID=UPI001CA3D30B|nr:hypothetical protein [Nocardioides coralli]QZY27626.1 hypothetical protein K6T13_08810 [Nocardioides coralli]
MTSSLPLSARLAWWGTAWLRGLVATDLVLDAVAADGRLHQGPDGESLVGTLGLLRVAGATGCGIALPVAGDPLGLGGPAELNDLALELGEAMVCAEAGLALVPEAGPEVVTWHVRPASHRQLPDVGEADRELRAETLRAADELAALDVARWRPEVADLLMARNRPDPDGPPGVPARCVALASRAASALLVVDLGLDDDGGALSVDEASRRRAALVPLERSARRALVAACSSEAWPAD